MSLLYADKFDRRFPTHEVVTTTKKTEDTPTGRGTSARGASGDKMALDAAIEMQETTVSAETAISCLTLLSTQFGATVDTENARSRQRFCGATLAISELIELASDFGFKAQYIHRDWPWLQLAVATQPILLLLKNGNTIVAVGAGRTGAEEIVVSDPLHRGGALIILPRGNIERAWDGDTVTIIPKSYAEENLETNRYIIVTENPSNRIEKTQIFSKLFGAILLGLGSIALASVLIPLTISEKSVVFPKPVPAVRVTAPLSATVPLYASAIANGLGHQHASDASLPSKPSNPESPAVTLPPSAPTPIAQVSPESSVAASDTSLPSKPSNPESPAVTLPPSALAQVAPESSVAASSASLPSKPSNPEPPAVTLSPSAPTPIAQVTPESSVADPTLSPRVPLGTSVPTQIATGAATPLSAGSPPAREGSGLSGDEKLSANDVAALLGRGDDQLRLGDVTSARLFYELAANAGEANAALRLGETFDPIFLNRANLHGVNGDLQRAVLWYYRARELGSNEAEKLLELTGNGVSR